jgi:hypothetical protein
MVNDEEAPLFELNRLYNANHDVFSRAKMPTHEITKEETKKQGMLELRLMQDQRSCPISL